MTEKRGGPARKVLEGVVAIVLVLASFGVLMFVLNLLFPTGTGFRALFGPFALSSHQGSRDGAGGDSFRIPGEPMEEDLTATIRKARNLVKARRAGAVAWSAAGEGMELYNRDAVQTFRQSSALIALDRENVLELRENSLVVINRHRQDLLTGKKRSLLLVVDGTLEGQMTGSEEGKIEVELATAAAVARVASPRAGRAPVEFAVTANPDSSSTFAVYGGELAVTAQGGTVTVRANQGVEVDPGHRPPQPVPLPRVPVVRSPEDGGRFEFRDLPPRIRFSWDSPEPAERYRFVLARDPGFRDLVVDEEVAAGTFQHGNLEAGEYYWRVSGKFGSLEGAASAPRTIRLVRDLETPPLRCGELPAKAAGGRILVAGETEPGAVVYVAGERVPTGPAGEFAREIPLRPGVNLILVEAVDPAGNSSYFSKVVHRSN